MENEIVEITQNIWTNVLGLQVAPSAARAAETMAFQNMAGCVQIAGAWQGTIVLSCTAVLARIVAGKMFEVPPEDASKDQTQDALGELANITGGNLKALLPGPSHLSLPTVVEGFDYRLRIPGSRILSQVCFELQDQSFVVALFERDPELEMRISNSASSDR